MISDPVQDLTGEEVLLTTQESNGTVTINLKYGFYWWENEEPVDVIIHDTTYASKVQKNGISYFVRVNVAQEVVNAQSSFATVVKKQGNKRAVADLTWENGSASGETGDVENGKGTRTLSLYYIYNNELPNEPTLVYPGDQEEYGPSGNNVPFIQVNVDVDKLLAHYGKVDLDDITPVTCGAVAKAADSEAKKSATENWWKWIVENCMDETTQTALKQTGIGNYYACYFINLNNDHGDGILTKEPPVYMVEMNYTEDDGQTQFLTGLVRGNDNPPAVSDVQRAFAEAIGATGDIDWTNKIFKKNGTYYSFSVTTDPAENAYLSGSIAYNEKFGSYFVTTYSVVSHRMKITHKPATIDVTKKDKDTKALLSGVKFQLYSNQACTAQNGVTTKESVTTNENGVASFTVTEPGYYYLKEITPLQGYKKLSDPVSIKVTVDENSFFPSGNNGTYNLSVGLVTVENEKCNHSNIPESSWSVVTSAGCTTEGTEKAICPDCGMEVTRGIPALGHRYNENDKWIDSEDGVTHYKNCERDATHTRKTQNHNWNTGKVTTEATCTAPGEKTYICTDCNATKTEPISALGHNLVDDAAVAATCTETGLTAGTHCDRDGCNYKTGRELISALKHDWGEWTVTTPPTKDSMGVETRTCKRDAKHVETRDVPKLLEETFTYTINRHLMKKDGNEVELSAVDKVVESGSKNENTLLHTLITSEMKQKRTNAGKGYVYVSSKTTYTVGEDTKETNPLTADSKLTKNTTIDLYYYLDEVGETSKENPDGGPDGIPDAWQYKVTFQVVNGNWNVSKNNKNIVVYVNAKNQAGEVLDSKLTASQIPAVGSEPNSGYNASGNWDPTPSTGLKITKDTVFTYTYDQKSGGSGGSGGSSRPSTPPTVDIPDDVPTGLNGKDHYAYIIGYGNNDVRPQNKITRAEVATIFFRLLTDETREANMTKSNGYNDVKDGDWFCCAVSTLSKMGIIKGYEDGSFKPNDPISRAEFAAIAARFDPNGDKTPASFFDVTSHWAKDEISIAANHGWIKGYEDGSFKPDQKITRAETMTLVNRVLNRLPETKDDLHKDMKTWVDNMDETAWYYLAVQEATNSHYFKNKTGTKFEQWTDLRDTRDWSELEK